MEPFVHGLEAKAGGVDFLVPSLANAIVGLVAGGLILALVTGVKKVLPGKKGAAA